MKKRKGFTLIELMAGLALFTIVMLALMSLLSTAIKYNSLNKRTYNSNINSKAFFEMIKSSKFSIPSGVDKSAISGEYKVAIDDELDIKDFSDNLIKCNISGLSSYRVGNGTANNFENLGKSGTLGVKIDWDNFKGVYIIESWVWDIGVGDISEINRKTYLAPK
ncbi:prepilin-type N-terminal cleavage/methylation domain-containing protein [Clostridium baratii]|uniref:type IV pilus modification PilV family protein n=1 Tax=Clostridium baratii TaxID=1561 RepID=UPI0030D17E7C